MSVINSQPLIGASGNQGGAYNLTRSLRFRSSASAYLNRTPASAGNRRTATFSFWIKRGSVATDQAVYSLGTFPTNLFEIIFGADNAFAVQNSPNSTTRDLFLATTQVFRDPSAWYHIVISIDTTQATASNRAKMYVNGSQITAFSTATYPNQNTDLNLGLSTATQIGRRADGNYYQDAYFSEFHHIDGQALDASSFGETDTATGVWKPKKYTGTYGTNGFYLKFDNLTSTSTLGNDSSGNSNTWTVNNISLTSGATYDSMKDVPTLTDADTANYCVINPLQKSSNATITNGNLSYSGGAASQQSLCTFGMTSGKWYWEDTKISGTYGFAGLAKANANLGTFAGNDANSWAYNIDGNKYHNGTGTAYGATWTSGDTIGIAFDADTGDLTFYKNGVSQGTAFTGLTSGPYFPSCCDFSTVGAINFGQRPFAYTPPSGFKALNTFNLPTPTIGATASTQANKYFDATTYTGNGSTLSVVNAGGFQPDLVWYKGRSAAYNHRLFDAIRGATKDLQSNSTDAEGTISGLTAFNSNGFTLGSEVGGNNNGSTYVAWQWNGGGSNATNTAGTITSTVRANTSAGFSIVTYTGTGANATVGHGLGVSPSMVIVKTRSASGQDWQVYHGSLGKDKILQLNQTNSVDTQSNYWGTGGVTSTVFGINGSFAGINGNGNTYVAYCFAEVAGYSRFGSYTGNGSTDGTFVYTGFRPRYLMVKRTDSTGEWDIVDAARNTSNVLDKVLLAHDAAAEATYAWVDFTSNGFKLRNTSTNMNGNGATYIFMAFAETPFKYSLAR